LLATALELWAVRAHGYDDGVALKSTRARRASRHRGLALSERRLLLGAGDVLAVGVAFVVGFNLRTARVQGIGLAVPRVALAITVATWLTAAFLVDGYRLAGTVNLRGTFRTVVGSMAVSFVGLVIVFFLLPFRITRPTLLLWLPLAGSGLLAWRLTYRQVFARDIFAGSLAVVADEGAFQRIWPDATGFMQGLYKVVAVVDPQRTDCSDTLDRLVAEGKVDQVVLGVRDDVSRELFRTLIGCYDKGVPVRSLSDLYEELTGRLLLDQLGHSWLLSLPMRSQTSRLYGGFKRAVDIVTGLLALAVLALLLPLIFVAVKIEDAGPIFYRQERLGQYGVPFNIWKLRTMRGGGQTEESQTANRDGRITHVGTILRPLHLDELPQGWNILVGEMSLIGPRPEQPSFVERLQRQIDFHKTRLSVRPGLTGWAQINYGYGEGVEGARVKLSYDLYYIRHQSAALDVLILARTMFAVLHLSGR